MKKLLGISIILLLFQGLLMNSVIGYDQQPMQGYGKTGNPTPDLPNIENWFLTFGPDAGMCTRPAGDGPVYQYMTIHARDENNIPIQGVPFTWIFFNIYGGNVTITPVDSQTNYDGELRYELVGEERIVGALEIGFQVITIVHPSVWYLDCNSFDIAEPYGRVELVDFVYFAGDYGGTAQRSDFNWDGMVSLPDFCLFSSHYGHHN